MELNKAIVADIGGTNARFAYADLQTLQLSNIEVFACADYSTIDEVIDHYRKRYALAHVSHAAIALACPIHDDYIKVTNLPWQFSVNALQQALGFKQLNMLNDFAAIALSLPGLCDREKIQIGQGQKARSDKPLIILGPGTGLGVSYLIPTANGFEAVTSEASHMSWSAENEQEWFIHQFLTKRYERVSVERVISGPGLEDIYCALVEYHNKPPKKLTAAEIAQSAQNQSDETAMAAIQQFLISLARFAGDLALSMNAYGGVYFAGGMLPKLIDLLDENTFRYHFEAKGRFEPINKHIPTIIITTPQPGLLGAAISLQQQVREIN